MGPRVVAGAAGMPGNVRPGHARRAIDRLAAVRRVRVVHRAVGVRAPTRGRAVVALALARAEAERLAAVADGVGLVDGPGRDDLDA